MCGSGNVFIEYKIEPCDHTGYCYECLEAKKMIAKRKTLAENKLY